MTLRKHVGILGIFDIPFKKIFYSSLGKLINKLLFLMKSLFILKEYNNKIVKSPIKFILYFEPKTSILYF